MESYLNTPRNYILIKVLFGIIMFILLTFITLLFTLSIDKKVSFEEGEIIAKNPTSMMIAPYEAEVISLRVQEGNLVNIGDTLAILKNQSVASNLVLSDKEVLLQQQKVKRLQQQITNLTATIQQKEKQRQFHSDKHQLNQTNATNNLRSLKQLVYAKKQSLAILKQQVSNSSKLLSKGSISKQEFEQVKQEYLDASSDYNIALQEMKQANSQEALLDNDFSTNLNELKLAVLEDKNEREALLIQLREEKIRVQQLKEQGAYQAKEVAKSFIIADKAGAIAHLYNQKTASNFLTKGAPLLSIIPQDSTGFYAKVLLPQIEVREVDKGQKAHLQLDAFSFMKYGIVKGKVSFINKDEENQFYALIDITEGNPTIRLKNGYSVKGDIIVKRIKLYAFAIEKLFKR